MYKLSPSTWIKKYFKLNSFFIVALTALLFTFSSCNKGHNHDYGTVIYVANNDYHDNANAILAYRHAGSNKPEMIPGSPFYTHGAGVGNPTQKLGPDDTETPVIIYKNKYLLAVNGGSNTIAVFKIDIDGSLSEVTGSPFPSGGSTPSSLATSGDYLFVVNKSDDPLHPSNASPNYTTFAINNNGKLTPVAGSTFETTQGASPTQVLADNDNKYVFGCDFLSFMQDPPKGTLRSFSINNAGVLNPVAGAPYTIPGMGGALGLWQHPKADVLYVGFPLQGKLGIYNINDATGALSFQSTVDGGLATCWIRVTKDGQYLYTLNSGENTISIFNSSNPLSLVSLGKITLKKSGPLYAGPVPGSMFTTSEDFHLAFSHDEKYLYVVSQHTNKDFSIGSYNYLHTLTVAGDGTLLEQNDPVQLPVTADIRPQGCAVY